VAWQPSAKEIREIQAFVLMKPSQVNEFDESGRLKGRWSRYAAFFESGGEQAFRH